VTVLRKGKPIDLTVNIGNLEEAVEKMAAAVQGRLGVVVRPVTAQEAQRYGMQTPMGVAIQSLTKDGVLAKAGFETDDIILGINKIPIEDISSFVGTVQNLKSGKRAQFTVVDHRSGQVGNILVSIP
jgi:S1-C subfamily serine protease